MKEDEGLDRRRFVQWTLLAPAVAALAVSGACRRTESEPGATEAAQPVRAPARGAARDPVRLAAEIRRRLDYLEIDEASLRRYCRDYLRHVGPPDLAGHDLYSRFLLSSDFFANGADEARTVRYVAFYDPYVTSCPNPFARLEL